MVGGEGRKGRLVRFRPLGDLSVVIQFPVSSQLPNSHHPSFHEAFPLYLTAHPIRTFQIPKGASCSNAALLTASYTALHTLPRLIPTLSSLAYGNQLEHLFPYASIFIKSAIIFLYVHPPETSLLSNPAY